MNICFLQYLRQEIKRLNQLINCICQEETIEKRLLILNKKTRFKKKISLFQWLSKYQISHSIQLEYLLKSIYVIKQETIFVNVPKDVLEAQEKFIRLFKQLEEVEQFYFPMGGIIGYHCQFLTLLLKAHFPCQIPAKKTHYYHPPGLRISEERLQFPRIIQEGIAFLDKVAHISPIGGAGDRLNLIETETGIPLPAAMLSFLGRTLLEGLIRDVQALEYLYFKVHRKQLTIPLVFMTSEEKNNHAQILAICEKEVWFHRPQENFYFFKQPLAPVITERGSWVLSSPLTLNLKPGGHGVIWKLCEDKGIFSWLDTKGREYGIMRQINNPLGATDSNLLMLIGKASMTRKSMGFLSCERLLNSAEGVNVLCKEIKHPKTTDYKITNIEYTDFVKMGVQETPLEKESPFSLYPANTNIFVVAFKAIQQIVKAHPTPPGQLINMKTTIDFVDNKGAHNLVRAGRLESTMQNIADHVIDRYPIDKEITPDMLSSFILYQDRCKTISTTKQSYQEGKSLESTPEQAYYNLLKNNLQLLETCQFNVPIQNTIEEVIQQGPSAIFLFHPALGPLYSIIEQKIRRGKLAWGANFQIDLAEVDIEDLQVSGSFYVKSISPLGYKNEHQKLCYGRESRCALSSVTIENKGLKRDKCFPFWKNVLSDQEAVTIILHEGAEFIARDVTLIGSHTFEVPAYHSLSINGQGLEKGGWQETLKKISQPTWEWEYAFDEKGEITLYRR